METLALKNYLERDFPCFSCLALGGGTLENPAARELLKSSPLLLCGIEEEEKVLFERILRKGLPPFLDSEDPAKTFHELYIRRSAGIREYCDVITPMNNLTIQEAVETIDRDIRNYRPRKTGA
jgi:shikimate kinase